MFCNLPVSEDVLAKIEALDLPKLKRARDEEQQEVEPPTLEGIDYKQEYLTYNSMFD